MRDSRRSPLLWVLVPLLILFGLAHFLPTANSYDWIFVYYMSYDNDLSPLGRLILRDLQNGIVNSKVAVTVQVDFADSRGMKRIVLYHKDGRSQKKESLLKSEDSADDIQLRKYLDWVRKKWKTKNYCIVFLDHGGTLNHMCKDIKPFKDHSRNKQYGPGKWLNASQARKILRNFNREAGIQNL